MQFEIVQMEDLSGETAKIYSVILEGEEESLLERFVLDNPDRADDVKVILERLKAMGKTQGCKAYYFKGHEGAPGDGMVALRYKQMRLYCLRYDNTCIFVGSGEYKPPGVAAYQEDPLLNGKAQQMKRICASINKAIVGKDLIVGMDGTIEMTDYIDLSI